MGNIFRHLLPVRFLKNVEETFVRYDITSQYKQLISSKHACFNLKHDWLHLLTVFTIP